MSKSSHDAAREHADELLQTLLYQIDIKRLTYDDLYGHNPDEILYEHLLMQIIKSYSHYDRSVLPE